MGKAYQDAAAFIEQTIDWAAKFPIDTFQRALRKSAQNNLICVASGGSLAAAMHFCALHQNRTGQLARAMTPLEFMEHQRFFRTSVLILSAGGGNGDILNAFNHAESLTYPDVYTLCGCSGSPLAARARSNFGPENLLIAEGPAGRDGFLATNSLVCFMVIALRIYGISVTAVDWETHVDSILTCPETSTFIVLHSPDLAPAAADVESRFVEAALANVQVADFRNFAHGRHHWLAKRAAGTVVLVMATRKYQQIMDDTVACLPADVPLSRAFFDDDSGVANVNAVLQSIAIAGMRAQALGWDSGRPSVPAFGEQVYNLTYEKPVQNNVLFGSVQKLASIGNSPVCSGREAFIQSIESTELRGVVLDYDGTIVDTKRRFDPVPTEIADELNRLLDEGMSVAIATGRGVSVCKAMRAAIRQELWGKVLIGYYNGGIHRQLDEELDRIAHEVAPGSPLKHAERALQSAGFQELQVDYRPKQITLSHNAQFPTQLLWSMVQQYLIEQCVEGIKVVVSSHSVDLIPADVSKRTVVYALAQNCGCEDQNILKIGDSGMWPGNDFELLAMTHALVVDVEPSTPLTGWNLSGGSLTGTKLTLKYLQAIQHQRFSWAD